MADAPAISPHTTEKYESASALARSECLAGSTSSSRVLIKRPYSYDVEIVWRAERMWLSEEPHPGEGLIQSGQQLAYAE